MENIRLYILINNRTEGPLDELAIKKALKNKEINEKTLVSSDQINFVPFKQSEYYSHFEENILPIMPSVKLPGIPAPKSVASPLDFSFADFSDPPSDPKSGSAENPFVSASVIRSSLNENDPFNIALPSLGKKNEPSDRKSVSNLLYENSLRDSGASESLPSIGKANNSLPSMQNKGGSSSSDINENTSIPRPKINLSVSTPHASAVSEADFSFLNDDAIYNVLNQDDAFIDGNENTDLPALRTSGDSLPKADKYNAVLPSMRNPQTGGGIDIAMQSPLADNRTRDGILPAIRRNTDQTPDRLTTDGELPAASPADDSLPLFKTTDGILPAIRLRDDSVHPGMAPSQSGQLPSIMRSGEHWQAFKKSESNLPFIRKTGEKQPSKSNREPKKFDDNLPVLTTSHESLPAIKRAEASKQYTFEESFAPMISPNDHSGIPALKDNDFRNDDSYDDFGDLEIPALKDIYGDIQDLLGNADDVLQTKSDRLPAVGGEDEEPLPLLRQSLQNQNEISKPKTIQALSKSEKQWALNTPDHAAERNLLPSFFKRPESLVKSESGTHEAAEKGVERVSTLIGNDFFALDERLIDNEDFKKRRNKTIAASPDLINGQTHLKNNFKSESQPIIATTDSVDYLSEESILTPFSTNEIPIMQPAEQEKNNEDLFAINDPSVSPVDFEFAESPKAVAHPSNQLATVENIDTDDDPLKIVSLSRDDMHRSSIRAQNYERKEAYAPTDLAATAGQLTENVNAYAMTSSDESLDLMSNQADERQRNIYDRINSLSSVGWLDAKSAEKAETKDISQSVDEPEPELPGDAPAPEPQAQTQVSPAKRPASVREVKSGNKKLALVAAIIFSLVLVLALLYHFYPSRSSNYLSGTSSAYLDSAFEDVAKDTLPAYIGFFSQLSKLEANPSLARREGYDDLQYRKLFVRCLQSENYMTMTEKMAFFSDRNAPANCNDNPWCNLALLCFDAFGGRQNNIQPEIRGDERVQAYKALLTATLLLQDAKKARGKEHRDILEKADKIFADNKDALVLAHFAHCKTQLLLGNNDQAVSCFTLLAQKEHLPSKVHLGSALLKSHKFEQAKSEIVKIDPEQLPLSLKILQMRNMAVIKTKEHAPDEETRQILANAVALDVFDEESIDDLHLAFVRNKDYFPCSQFFQKLYQENPTQHLFNVQSANCLLNAALTSQYEFDSAIQTVAAMLKESKKYIPRNKDLFLTEIRMHMENNELEKAEDLAQNLFSLYPSCIKANAVLYEVRAHKEDKRAKAVESLRALDSDDLNFNECFFLARVYARLKLKDDAERMINTCTEKFSTNMLIADTFKLESALDSNDMERAMAIRQKLIDNHSFSAYHKYLFARLLEKQGKQTEAIELMTEALQESPNTLSFILFTGKLYHDKGYYAASRRNFEHVLTIFPGNVNAEFYIGLNYYKEKKYQQALPYFKTVSEANGAPLEYSLYYGLCLEKLGRVQEAVTRFNTSLQKISQNLVDYGNQQVVFLHRRAMAYYAINRRPEALEDLKQAIEINPQYFDAKADYAKLLFESGDIAQATKLIREVQHNTSHQMSPKAYYLLGLCELSENNLRQALDALLMAEKNGFVEQSLEEGNTVLDPYEIYRQIGYLYRDLNNKKQAKQYLNTFIDKSPNLSKSEKRQVQHEIRRL